MRIAYGIYAAAIFMIVTFLTLVVVAVLPGEHRRRSITRNSAGLLLRLWGAKPKVAGLDNIPPAPCVVVANHASYLDGIILTAVLPPRFGFVIKREMTRVPLAHLLLRRLGSEFVERFDARGGARDARRILRQAKMQKSLAFFPEGTFIARRGLQKFRPGAFLIAARGDASVVPVAITGSRDMLPARRLLPVPGDLSVWIMPAIAPEPNDGDAVATLISKARQSILSALDEPDLLTELGE